MPKMSACLLLMLTLVTPQLHAEAVKARHVTVELLAEHTAVTPGESLWVLLQFAPDKGWHTYWKNPGDSGLAPVLNWQLPPGWQAKAPLFPTPEAIPYGSQMNFGYHGNNGLLVELVPPTQIAATNVNLKLNARWLVCADECVPGQGTFALTLPVKAQTESDPGHATLFARSRAALPVALAGAGTFSLSDEQVQVNLPVAGLPAGELQVFVAPGQIAEPGTVAELARQNDRLQIRLTRHSYFSGAPEQIELVLTQSGKGWSIPATLISPSHAHQGER